MLIHDFLIDANKLFPDKAAVVCGNDRFTYSEFFIRSLKLAVYLQSVGIKKGDVISVLLQNCHRFLELYYACSFSGIILNSINTRLTAREIERILNDSESKLIFSQSMFEEKLTSIRNTLPDIVFTDVVPNTKNYESCIWDINMDDFRPVDVNEDDIAHLYYTSGTTGKPKGVMLTHKNVTVHSMSAVKEFNLTDTDNWLHAAPMFHLADAWATFAITAVAGKHIICPAFKPETALNLIQNEKVTLSNLIPTMLNYLVNFESVSDYDLSSLRVILSGGASISPELVRKIIDIFGCDYIQTYGMTETSPYLTVSILKDHMKELPFEDKLKYKSKTGRTFLGVSLKIVREDGSEIENDDLEIGEIIVKGETVTPGYWKLPEETNKSIICGWLHTGDMATIDKEGYVNIVDRKKDIIITGGENVYSIEVENALYQHPAVLEAAVIGKPHEVWGETVHAVIVLRNNIQITKNDLLDFLKDKLADFKIPKSIEFMDLLPKTGTGKISKSILRSSIK